MRYLHEMIVDNRSKVVCGEPICLHHDEVVLESIIKTDSASNDIIKLRAALKLHLEPDYRCRTLLFRLLAFRIRKVTTAAVIASRPFSRQLNLTHLLEALPGAIAVVCFALVNKLLSIFLIEIKPLGLEVWTIVSADLGPLVPLQTQPSQARHHLLK